MRPMGPAPLASSGWSMMCTSIGSTKAAVFPEPVAARPCSVQQRQRTLGGRQSVLPELVLPSPASNRWLFDVPASII